MLFDNAKNAKNELIKFDSEIKKISVPVYEQLNTNKFISLVRKGNYNLFSVIRLAYKTWTNIKY